MHVNGRHGAAALAEPAVIFKDVTRYQGVAAHPLSGLGSQFAV